MNCPLCSNESKVLQTTQDAAGDTARRRACIKCKHRFTTVEVMKQERKRISEIVADARELAEKLAEA